MFNCRGLFLKNPFILNIYTHTGEGKLQCKHTINTVQQTIQNIQTKKVKCAVAMLYIYLK